MQATLDSTSLRNLTRGLTCLSKYGEDLTIYATPETLALSTTNSSQSAYCRFKYSRQFFSRYTVGTPSDIQEFPSTMGQLLTKPLLSILKHRTVEKTVEKCELSITDGGVGHQDESSSDNEEDSLESKLTAPSDELIDLVPDTPYQSRLTIGPRALKDIIEHFPSTKSGKSDPQLVWSFGDADVQVKSIETSLDTKGKAQLATELTISADEFDNYEVHEVPTTIAFHLREFNATIAFAEAASLALEISFTDPTAPLFIDVNGDLTETLFVISTSLYSADAASRPNNGGRIIPNGAVGARNRGKKRAREDTVEGSSDTGTAEGEGRQSVSERRKPMKVVQSTDRALLARELDTEMPMATPRSARVSMPPPSMRPPLPLHSQGPAAGASNPRNPNFNEPLFLPSSQAGEQELHVYWAGSQHDAHTRATEPLFLPSTQLSQAEQEVIRQSGLDIENMTAEEFAAMLDDDGDEVDIGARSRDRTDDGPPVGGDGSLDIYDEVEMEPTQHGAGPKAFRPLFDD